LSDLARHFEDVGLVRNGVIEDTIEKLRIANVKEYQLRSSSAEDVLKRAEITVGARKAIILRYQNSTAGNPSHSRV
jgi:hypothetical protein